MDLVKLSIPDADGIELVVFHVNVNQKIEAKEGDYTKYIVRPSNGNWVYKYDVKRLKLGDKVYVRVVVLKGGLQHVNVFEPFIVRDLQTPPTDEHAVVSTPSTTQWIEPVWTSTTPTPPSLSGNCQAILQNVTKVTLQLEDKLTDALETVEALKELLPGPYFIKISGTITQTFDDPYEVVNIALKSKLQVKSVRYKTCSRNGNHIVCELASIDDKVELVKCAKRNPTVSSQIRIIY